MSVDGVSSSVSGIQPTDQKASEEVKPAGTSPALSRSSSSTIGNLAKLKEEAPEVYQKMLEAMFQEINKQDQKHQKKMKELRQNNER